MSLAFETVQGAASFRSGATVERFVYTFGPRSQVHPDCDRWRPIEPHSDIDRR